MPSTVKDALKGNVVIYGRISSAQQRKTLDNQIETVMELLKSQGFKKKPLGIFTERVSGAKVLPSDRPELYKAIEMAKKRKGQVAIVVKDISRFSRNPWGAGYLLWPLIEDGINVVDLTYGKVAGKGVEDDLVLPILAAVAAQEPAARKKVTQPAVKQAREKGIVKERLDLYPDEDGPNPYRTILERRAEGFSYQAIANLLGRSDSFVKKADKRLKRFGADDKKREEWLNVLDMIRDMEIKHGPRFQRPARTGTRRGKKPSRRMIAIGRMTSGYIESPFDFPAPKQKDLDFFFENYLEFQPKR